MSGSSTSETSIADQILVLSSNHCLRLVQIVDVDAFCLLQSVTPTLSFCSFTEILATSYPGDVVFGMLALGRRAQGVKRL